MIITINVSSTTAKRIADHLRVMNDGAIWPTASEERQGIVSYYQDAVDARLNRAEREREKLARRSNEEVTVNNLASCPNDTDGDGDCAPKLPTQLPNEELYLLRTLATHYYNATHTTGILATAATLCLTKTYDIWHREFGAAQEKYEVRDTQTGEAIDKSK